jgi:hypothetical protein
VKFTFKDVDIFKPTPRVQKTLIDEFDLFCPNSGFVSSCLSDYTGSRRGRPHVYVLQNMEVLVYWDANNTPRPRDTTSEPLGLAIITKVVHLMSSQLVMISKFAKFILNLFMRANYYIVLHSRNEYFL